jgi:hypothetical protein
MNDQSSAFEQAEIDSYYEDGLKQGRKEGAKGVVNRLEKLWLEYENDKYNKLDSAHIEFFIDDEKKRLKELGA